jgi:hypothetical protein
MHAKCRHKQTAHGDAWKQIQCELLLSQWNTKTVHFLYETGQRMLIGVK